MSDPKPDAPEPKTKKAARQVPSIGRGVHYVAESGQHLAAIITNPKALMLRTGGERSEGQALTVLPEGGAPVAVVAEENADGTPGTWHWPEHVGAE